MSQVFLGFKVLCLIQFLAAGYLSCHDLRDGLRLDASQLTVVIELALSDHNQKTIKAVVILYPLRLGMRQLSCELEDEDIPGYEWQ